MKIKTFLPRLGFTSLLLGVSALLLPSGAFAASNLNTSGDYLTAGNWSAGIPGNSDFTGNINTGRTATISGSTSFQPTTLNIGANTPSGGTLVINSGASLTAGTTSLLSYGLLGSSNSGVITHNGGSFTTTTLDIGFGLASGQTPANTEAALYTINGGVLTATTLNVSGGTSRKGSMVVNGGAVGATTLAVGNNGSAGNLTITGGSVTVSGVLSLNATGATNVGTSIIAVSGGSFNLNAGSSITILNTANTPNQKSISVSGSGVVNLGGRDTGWANGGATTEYGFIAVSGGELNFQNANTALGNSSTFTGGKVTGLNTLNNNTMTINGSEFHVGSNTAAASTTTLTSVATTSFNITTGMMVFGAYADSSADIFLKGNLASANLTGGTMVVDFKYTPIVGHSYNFVDWVGSGMSLTTANISSTSYDGLWNIGWNTSAWTTTGVLTVNSVSAVPEPSTSLLLGAGLVIVTVFRRRRS